MNDSYASHGLTGQRWFAPVVGLWCALLVGGGLYLMPPTVHATLARSTGLAQLSSIFALPLNQTGVLALCLLCALAALALGWIIAWRIAAAAAPRAFAPGFDIGEALDWDEDETSPPEDRRRRIFSASEELAHSSLDLPPSIAEDTVQVEEETLQEQAGPEANFEAVYAEWDEAGGLGGDTAGEPEIELLSEPAYEPLHEPIVEDAEYSEIEDEEPNLEEDELAEEEPAEPFKDEEPMGDMSLEGLLSRLESALDTHRALVAEAETAASKPPPAPVPMTPARPPVTGAHDDGLADISDDDPVIAFLRREANRRMPLGPAERSGPDEQRSDDDVPPAIDPQAALRSALDRLGQVGRSDS